MSDTRNDRPQVPGGSGIGVVDDGKQNHPGARGAKNLRARSIPRQTTQAKTKPDSDKTLNILTYNVRTLKSEERLLELENSLTDINWDIVGLCEVRREGEDTIERDSCIFYYCGNAGGLYGVGFLVNKKWKNNIIEFISYSDRIALLKFKVTHSKTLSIIQAHAPTTTHSDDEIEDFYDTLNKACEEHHSNWNIVVGDFNAKIGEKEDTDCCKLLGPHGLGARNERGSRLIQFAFGQNLFISNSYFKKKPSRRWTWFSPGNRYQNEIDYILSSDQAIIKNIQALNTMKFSSDHRPLRATITFDIKLFRKKLFKNRVKLLNKETLLMNKQQFNLDLKNSFSSLDLDTDDVQIQFNNIENSIKSASRKTKRIPNKLKKLSAATIALIEDRLILAKDVTDPRYRLKDKEVKRSIRKDIRLFKEKTVQIALESNRSLKIAKQGISQGKSWITGLKDNLGKKHQSRDKILDICTNFYQRLYCAGPNKAEPLAENYCCPDSIPPITSYEVHCALQKMKYSRVPGEDGISTEALKIGETALLPHVTNLFNSILSTGKFPKQFCHSNVILIHKKGEKSDINNYRPISLVSHVYKAFIKVIENRIRKQLDSEQPPEQAGFRTGLSTTDHLHTINQILEKHHEFQIPLYLAFVDYSKAFDSISHSAIFGALQNQNIDETYIKIIKQIYLHSTAAIKIQTPGPSFPIEKGVKQGDPLSPKLFNSTLEEIFRKLAASWAHKGIEVGGVRLTNLRFADDIVLFANTAQELQSMLEHLSNASLEVGLMMNMSKTKVMTNSTAYSMTVNGETMHYVHEYIYLGQVVSLQTGRQDKEIARRTENAWRTYWSMKELLKGNLPMKLKSKLMDMCILPVLTYGSQTWSLTNIQKSKLKVCQRAMERSILGIKRTDRVRNTILRSKTKISDVGHKAAWLKWDWAGHVCRMPDDLWAKTTTEWCPDTARRRRGRPRMRWRDELDAYERDWRIKARDRSDWRKWGEAFAQQWDTMG